MRVGSNQCLSTMRRLDSITADADEFRRVSRAAFEWTSPDEDSAAGLSGRRLSGVASAMFLLPRSSAPLRPAPLHASPAPPAPRRTARYSQSK